MQNGGLSIGGSSSMMGALEVFVADSNEALHFKLVREEKDLDQEEEDGFFKPEMTHQIYGENENIFGYANLCTELFMSASSLKAYVRMTYDEVVNPKKTGGVEPDPVIEPLLKLLAPGQAITDNYSEFVSYIKSDKEIKFVPPGEKISSFDIEVDGSKKTFDVFLADESVPGFRDYHARLQPWIMFYIDAASYLDIDDNNWRFFLLFEKFVDSERRPRHAIAGYLTVYKFFGYPEHMRPRISQMMILPPFQRKGLGSKLLNTVCQHYWNNDKVLDITVEDPSEDFVRLRDFVDVSNCLEMIPCFSDPKKVMEGFSEEMVKEANAKLKLCKRQVRRVYEIIRLHWTKKSGPLNKFNKEYEEFRIDVKKRLNIPFQKEKRQLSKLQKVLKPEEFVAATVNITDKDQRLSTLETQYKELEEHYLAVLERIAAK